jgi:putative phosphoribosyl transferase
VFNFANDELRFTDRQEAGRRLAEQLAQYAGRDDVVILALPRGGVPVGAEVARALRAPLDVFLVRKLGLPGYRELAMGAIATGGVRVLNEDVITVYGVSPAAIEEVAREEQRELRRREVLYRGNRPSIAVAGKIAILVDDGLATGSTMRAAVQAVRAQGPAHVIVAVPIGAAQTCDELADEADVVVCARTPEPFAAVGAWYRDFSETSDAEVQRLLEEHASAPKAHAARGGHGNG